MARKPCARSGPNQVCLLCEALGDEECPYEGLSDGLTQTPKVTVIGGECGGEDGVCESCQ